MTAPLSPTLAELFARLDPIRRQMDAAIVKNKQAHEDEATAEADYSRIYNMAFLRLRAEPGEGGRRRTEAEAKAAAELEAEDAKVKLLAAVSMRRATQDALSAWGRELEVIEAMAHLANRELKTIGGQV